MNHHTRNTTVDSGTWYRSSNQEGADLGVAVATELIQTKAPTTLSAGSPSEP